MAENEKCPVCEKGFLRKTLDEVEKGISVEALRCSKCKEVFYAEEIMRKIEAMKNAKAQQRRVVKIGNSLAAIIPSEIAKKLGLKEKRKIYVEEEKGQIIIRIANTS